MKLVKFMCTVAVLKAQEKAEALDTEVETAEPHVIWINPEDVQMVAPVQADKPDHVFIFFRGRKSGSTSVEGTFEEVVAALTSA